jgi:hypothetical protein
MKRINLIPIILIIFSIYTYSQPSPSLKEQPLEVTTMIKIKYIDGKPEKYLFPKYDTMDVLEVRKQDTLDFIITLGAWGIKPIIVDPEKPDKEFYLPKRIAYDTAFYSIRTLINTLDEAYFKISDKKIKLK